MSGGLTIQVSIDPAEMTSLTAFATVGYVQSQIAALTLTIDAAIAGVETSNYAAAALENLPTTASMTLTDSIVAIIGGQATLINAENFLQDLGTSVQSLSLSTNAVAGPDSFVSVQNGNVVLQQASAISNYVLSQLPYSTKQVVELTTSTALDSSIHNNKILVCSAPIEILIGLTWVGSGMTAKIVNISTGNVTFSSGFRLSSGNSNLQPGETADLTTFTYSGGNVYFVSINGGSPTLTSTGVTISVPTNYAVLDQALAVSGQVYPSASGVQVALSTNATTMPTSGWVNAAVSGTSYSATLTPTVANTYYVWARLTANNAVFAVSSAVIVAPNTISITTAGYNIENSQTFNVVGAVEPSGTAVIVGTSISNSAPPFSWQNATVNGTTWSASLTWPGYTQTFYVWAAQQEDTGVYAVSSAFTDVAVSAAIEITQANNEALVSGSATVTIIGTVVDSGSYISVGLSSSSTQPPTSYVSASVSGDQFTGQVTVSAAGIYYAWAKETAPRTASTVYSRTVEVLGPVSGLSITSFPTSQLAGTTLAIQGTVTDTNPTVQIGLSTSNTTPPTNFQNATVVGGVWSIQTYESVFLLPGTYYIWAQETTPNVGVAISSTPVTLTNPPTGINFVPIPSSGNSNSDMQFQGVLNIPSNVVQPISENGNGVVYIALSTSNTTMPALTVFSSTNGTVVVSESNDGLTNFNGYVVLPSAGTYYLWGIYVDGSTSNPNTGALNSAGVIYSTVASPAVVVSAAIGSVAITTLPANVANGGSIAVAGTVGDSGGSVQVGLSTSASTPPSTFVAATVSGNTWSHTFTNYTTAGTFYLWAEETSPSVATAISSTTVTVAAPITPVVITTFTTPVSAGANTTVSGTCESGASITVGLSASTTTAPTSTVSATVTGTSWTTSVPTSASGTFYIWAIESTPNAQHTTSSTTLSVTASITYSLVSGSGNGSLTTQSMTTTAIGQAVDAVNWQNPLTHGSSFTPNVVVGTAPSSAYTMVFYMDTNNTATLPSSGGTTDNYVVYNQYYEFPPVTAPSAGTYYGKYAIYNSSSTLLGVFVTNAITVS
jgi:hypothetical protein